MVYEQKAPSAATIAANEDAIASFAMDDREDFDDVDRGFIAPIPDDRTLNSAGEAVYDGRFVDFISDEAPRPGSVHPSLWRQSQVVIRAGLYRVTDRLYQVRGNGHANVTIVDGDDGLVVIDCNSGIEPARQAMQLFAEHVNDKPVAAVIYTHTHYDHYAGVKGIVDPAQVASGKVPILAPGTIASFDKFAIGENVIAGNSMSRRASYAFGFLLPRGPLGAVTAGLSNIPSHIMATQTYISPTDGITDSTQVRRIAGLTFEFVYAPDTEAPEEMHIYIPELRAMTCAENANHAMHNIQTLRGARTRDARNFARYIDESLVRWGDEVDVHFGTHTWPVFGNAKVVAFLESQRDTYKYMHDQALRLANQGLTPIEAAEQIELPPVLGRKWYNRYYHGALHHNVRAVFAKELGFWDGDPASLWPLLPVDYARRHVDLIGADTLLEEGRRAVESADYRWAVQVLHHLVFADPDNTEAKNLQADAYEQLGYQSEVPQWRAIFLTAAKELRQGVEASGGLATASPDTIGAMPIDILFDFTAIHVIGEKAALVDIRVNFTITDRDEQWTMWVGNGVLNARPAHAANVQLSISGPKAAIVRLLLQPAQAMELVRAGTLNADGDTGVLGEFASVMEDFDPRFNLVTP